MATTQQSLGRRMLPPPAKKGETYAGIVFKKGKPKYHLFKRPEEADALSFEEATAFGDKAAASPNRDDLRVMHISIPHKFKTDRAYWSNEQYAHGSSTAWYQWFLNGNQLTWYKDGKYRACAVRRVPI